MIGDSIEGFIFEFIDQCKLLFFPEQWNNTFLDYSKNEVFALLLVYRRGHVNMTEIAQYLGVPLNTATGIVSRLEKRGVIRRERDLIDKRVVTIAICEDGKEFLTSQFKLMEHYYTLLMNSLSEDEKLIFIKLIGKFLEIVSQDLSKTDNLQEEKKKVKKITIE
jgi:DNA-binding MarR family transcriptional regulator